MFVDRLGLIGIIISDSIGMFRRSNWLTCSFFLSCVNIFKECGDTGENGWNRLASEHSFYLVNINLTKKMYKSLVRNVFSSEYQQ